MYLCGYAASYIAQFCIGMMKCNVDTQPSKGCAILLRQINDNIFPIFQVGPTRIINTITDYRYFGSHRLSSDMACNNLPIIFGIERHPLNINCNR
jgi:hypothetical protein